MRTLLLFNTGRHCYGKFNALSPGNKIIENDLELLGVGLMLNSTRNLMAKRNIQLKIMFERLLNLNYHVFLLKNCFVIPKLTNFLRTSYLFRIRRYDTRSRL